MARGLWFLVLVLVGLAAPAHADGPADIARLAGLEDPASTVVLLRQGSSTCAGAFVDAEGHIATAYHCVADGGPVTVETRDGRRARASIVSRLPSWDVAVLASPAFAGEPYLAIRDEPLILGETVRAWGHPLGAVPPGGFLFGTLRWSVSEGILSVIGRRALQITAPVNPGSSGGPVVDEEGRLVGIVSRRLRGDGLGFAARAEVVSTLLDSPHRGSPLGGSIRAEVAFSMYGAAGGDVALGGRIEGSVRDRLVLGLGAAASPGAQFRALRFGTVQWQAGEARLGLRQRLGTGYWTTRAEVYGGVGVIQQVSALGEPASFRVDITQRLAPMGGFRLAVATVAIDVALIPDGEGGTATRTLMALQWPGRLGVF